MNRIGALMALTGFVSMVPIVMMPSAALSADPAAARVDTAAIGKVFGKPGEEKGDVYRVSLPRTDMTATVKGITLRPGFALVSWVAFKPVGTQTVTHGDLVVTDDEVGA